METFKIIQNIQTLASIKSAAMLNLRKFLLFYGTVASIALNVNFQNTTKSRDFIEFVEPLISLEYKQFCKQNNIQ